MQAQKPEQKGSNSSRSARLIQPRHPHTRHAPLGRPHDRLGGQPAKRRIKPGARGQRARADLGGDDDLVTDAAAAPPAPEQFLALAALSAVHPEGVIPDVSMKVPPASTNRSRMANDVASSVRLPISIAPRLSALTSRLVAGSDPIVRYLMTTSLGNGERSKVKPGSEPPEPPKQAGNPATRTT